ncbi:hypothetical protein [Microlunatus sp. Gsoil 973]|uniref:hypothetical protein n=1 Tax=Microlunatus sp. Gsoil 973 TaxID=2672569 RepID=UPI0012B4D37D|nr:hypothetical protein [Microlunatus sp. Gsoil 973]QGN34476.1 hypothetical protein GJV80_18505 [Microlunatus sp. Gsoil 973]
MMHAISGPEGAGAGYGARPVSVDLTRNQRLIEVADGIDATFVRLPARRHSYTQVEQQLALAHWPADHRIFVCSLAGGTGRTTLAGLIALTLAGLPYAHLHRPVALAELEPFPLTRAGRRWGVPQGRDHIAVTRAGGRVRIPTDLDHLGDGRPLVIVDSPAGIVTTAEIAANNPTSSVVLLTRPDRLSLGDTADALVWLAADRGIVRERIAVVINSGVGRPDRASRPAATALAIRCGSVHRLPAHMSLGPGAVLPSGHRVPRPVRNSLIQLCADLHRSIPPAVNAGAPWKEESDAESDT